MNNRFIKNILFIFFAMSLSSSYEPAAFAANSKTIGDILKSIEKKSKTKKNKKDINIKKQSTNVYVPRSKEGPAETSERKNLKSIKPPSAKKFMAGQNQEELELNKYTDEEIRQLYQLAQQYKRSKRRGEIWLRLAEAYVDKAKIIEGQLQQAFDDKLDSYRQGKTKVKPRLDLSPVKDLNKKAIQLYEWFLKDFPKDKKVDQALFFLGYNYFELSEFNKGLFYYNKLTSNFPKSSYIPETYFSIGEFHFENERWKEALPNYLKVSKIRSSRLFSFSLYKLAWCEYKFGDIQTAMNYLERVIKESTAPQRTKDGQRSRIRLADEAMRDLIPFYAESKDYKGARAYFSKIVPRDKLERIMERLTYYYNDTGKTIAARYHFKDLISRDPFSPKAFDYQYQIVKIFTTNKNIKVLKQELYVWISSFGPKSRWAKVNAKNEGLVKKSQELMETTLRTYVLQNHQTAQNSRGETSQQLAQSGYELYFDNFKDSKNIGDMHFFFAELLFDMKSYEKAAFHYLWVAENDPKNKYYEKAILNAILALEKKIPNEKEIKKVVGDSADPVEMDRATKLFSKIAVKYFDAFPKTKNTAGVRYRLAMLYYFYRHKKEALESFKEIVDKHAEIPADRQYVESSINYILEIYNKDKDYKNLEEVSKWMLTKPSIAKSKLGFQLRDIMQQAAFKNVEVASKEDQSEKSAESFESFYNKYKGTNLATKAAFNAGVSYEKSGNMTKAIEQYQAVLRSRSKQDASLRIQALMFLATLYKRTGQYEKTAESYERFASENPRDKRSPDFYYNAAIIREGMNFYNLALKNYDNYYRLVKTKERFEAIFYKAKVHEKREHYKSAIAAYKQYIGTNPSNAAHLIESTFKIGLLYEKQNNLRSSKPWYEKTIAIQRKTKNKYGRQYAAEAQFKITYKLVEDLKAIKLPKNPAKAGPVLVKKINLAEVIKNDLAKVIAYDDGFQIVAALTAFGEVNEDMYKTIIGSKIPDLLLKKGEEERLKQYKEAIAQKAEPYRLEALSNYEASMKKASTFEAYNDWVKIAATSLTNLKNEDVAKFDYKVYVTSIFDSTDFLMEKSKENRSLVEKVRKAKNEKQGDLIKSSVAEVLSKDENNLYALNILALYYYANKKYGLARLLLERAIDADKEEAILYNNLGVVYLDDGEIKKALGAFRKSLNLNPKYRVAAANIGAVYLKYKDYGRSLSPLEDGYKLVKSEISKKKKVAIEMANNYAVVLAGLGKFEKAEEIFEKILDSNDREVFVSLNYAILLVDELNKKDKALSIISKVKFLTSDTELLRIVERLEKKAYKTEDK